MRASPTNPAAAGPTAGNSASAWPLPARGARVQLRALRASDLEHFQRYRRDPEVGRYQGWLPMSGLEARVFLESMAPVRAPVPGAWIQLGIAEVTTDQLIGDVGLYMSDDMQSAEIGFSCDRAYQGRGLATEAIGLMLQLIFEHSSCTAVRGVVDTRNQSSIRLLERLGFVREATRDAVFRGTPCVEVTFAKRRTDRPL